MSDLFDEDAPVRACSPVTIKHRRFQIRMMASALVLSGIEVRSLSDLVVPDNFRQGIQFMLDRQEGRVTEALFGLASGIKAIARHYVKVGEEELNQLRRICTRLDQTADRYRKKNKDRLDQFDDPRNLMLLLMLPAHLEAKFRKPGPRPRCQSINADRHCAGDTPLLPHADRQPRPSRYGAAPPLDTMRSVKRDSSSISPRRK